LTIKYKLGKGAFCSVRHATCKVFREIPGEEEPVEGIQEMAVKIYDKVMLKKKKCSAVDPVTGVSKLSDQLSTI
jgi:calcium-dependent protein kinase